MANATLWAAALNSDVQALQESLDNGADVNFQGKVGGDTALHIVCSTINNDAPDDEANARILDVVKVLVLADADLGIKNHVGNTALDIARRKRYTAVADLLNNPKSIEPPPPPTPPPTPPKPLEELQGDELLGRAQEAEARAHAAEKRAADAESRVAALEQQNQQLMAQMGGYNFPQDDGKKQPLQPLRLAPGQGRADAARAAGGDSSQQIAAALGSMTKPKQLQPLPSNSNPMAAATMSIVDVVDDRQQQRQQRQQLQPSASAPALSQAGPEALLQAMLQRGDINFREYKEQLKKLKQ